EFVDEIGLGQHPAAIIKDTAKAAFQCRSISKREGRDRSWPEKCVVRQKGTIDLLRSRLSKIEYRADIAENSERGRSEYRYPILHVCKKLSIAADKPEIFRKECRVGTARSGQQSKCGDLACVARIKTGGRSIRRTRSVCRDGDVSRCHVCIERS